jgi:hypothetical protein
VGAQLPPSTPEGPIGLYEGVAPSLWVVCLLLLFERPIGLLRVCWPLYEGVAPHSHSKCLCVSAEVTVWVFKGCVAMPLGWSPLGLFSLGLVLFYY